MEHAHTTDFTRDEDVMLAAQQALDALVTEANSDVVDEICHVATSVQWDEESTVISTAIFNDNIPESALPNPRFQTVKELCHPTTLPVLVCRMAAHGALKRAFEDLKFIRAADEDLRKHLDDDGTLSDHGCFLLSLTAMRVKAAMKGTPLGNYITISVATPDDAPFDPDDPWCFIQYSYPDEQEGDDE